MDLDFTELEKAGKVTSEDVVHNVNKVFREIVNLQSRG
jgi:hypothetical protein